MAKTDSKTTVPASPDPAGPDDAYHPEQGRKEPNLRS